MEKCKYNLKLNLKVYVFDILRENIAGYHLTEPLVPVSLSWRRRRHNINNEVVYKQKKNKRIFLQ